jgi:hypothetical protein
MGMLQKFGLGHASSAEILRAAVASGTALGNEAKAAMEGGAGSSSISDDLLSRVIIDALTTRPEFAQGWLLDGFPRTVAHCEALSAAGLFPHAVVQLANGSAPGDAAYQASEQMLRGSFPSAWTSVDTSSREPAEVSASLVNIIRPLRR